MLVEELPNKLLNFSSKQVTQQFLQQIVWLNMVEQKLVELLFNKFATFLN